MKASFSFRILIKKLLSRFQKSTSGSNNKRIDTPEFTLTRHAAQRMTERCVSLAEVRSTLANPTHVKVDSANQSRRYQRKIGDRLVSVWVVDTPELGMALKVKTVAAGYEAVLVVPDCATGAVIGRKGTTIQDIRFRTQAYIRLVDGVALISANTRAAVEEASAAITEIILVSNARAA